MITTLLNTKRDKIDFKTTDFDDIKTSKVFSDDFIQFDMLVKNDEIYVVFSDDYDNSVETELKNIIKLHISIKNTENGLKIENGEIKYLYL